MKGALFGLAAMALYLVPLILVLSAVDLLLGAGRPHDGAFGIVSLLYTAAWVGAAVNWLAR